MIFIMEKNISFYFLLYNNFSVLSIYSYTYCVFLFVSVRPRVEGCGDSGWVTHKENQQLLQIFSQ